MTRVTCKYIKFNVTKRNGKRFQKFNILIKIQNCYKIYKVLMFPFINFKILLLYFKSAGVGLRDNLI